MAGLMKIAKLKLLMMEKYLHDTAELSKVILKMKKAQEKLLMKKDGFILVTWEKLLKEEV